MNKGSSRQSEVLIVSIKYGKYSFALLTKLGLEGPFIVIFPNNFTWNINYSFGNKWRRFELNLPKGLKYKAYTHSLKYDNWIHI